MTTISERKFGQWKQTLEYNSVKEDMERQTSVKVDVERELVASLQTGLHWIGEQALG